MFIFRHSGKTQMQNANTNTNTE